MNLVRGGGFTALVLAAVGAGCGATPNDSASTPSIRDDDGGVVTTVEGPDGAATDAPPPRAPVQVGGEAPDGIFVSSSKGIDGADGAKLRPLRTIHDGLALAAIKKLPLIVCAEVYKESLTLIDGVSVYGYFDCSNLEQWKRMKSRATVMAPTSPALRAKGLVLPARFEGFDVVAPNESNPTPSGPAASSYGMFVTSSKNLTFSDILVRAGNAADGRSGTAPTGPVETKATKGVPSQIQGKCLFGGIVPLPGGGVRTLPCSPVNYTMGKRGGESGCGGGPGGMGGNAPLALNHQYQQSIGGNQARGAPSITTAVTAAGGDSHGLGKEPGFDGASGGPGANGSNGVWSFASDGFVPGDGTAGAVGHPGQGGGGGAGTTVLWVPIWLTAPMPYAPDSLPGPETWLGAAGAGGGAGGCGGLPGSPGTGGGASVGALVIDSEIAFAESVEIRAGNGGAAGAGTLGTVGTTGGAGGVGAPDETELRGAPGGKGGDGGSAGLSGNGAPGPSVALAYRGTRPTTLPDVSLVAGIPGKDAPALTRGAQSLPATTGTSKQEHSF